SPCPVVARYPHILSCLSFPTRPSSDLIRGEIVGRNTVFCFIGEFTIALIDKQPSSGVSFPFSGITCQVSKKQIHQTIIVGIESRSEEHTSERQSRENLVCRLLLEKKKK